MVLINLTQVNFHSFTFQFIHILDCLSKMHAFLYFTGDLYLVPFAVLKGPKNNQYLYERFGLIVSPSLTALSDNNTTTRFTSAGSSGALVVGNPHLPPSIKEQWHLTDLPSAEQEAQIVGEMMGVKPITGRSASKETVLRNVPNTEVCTNTEYTILHDLQ